MTEMYECQARVRALKSGAKADQFSVWFVACQSKNRVESFVR